MTQGRWNGFGRHRRPRARWSLFALAAAVVAASALAVTFSIGPLAGSQPARASADQGGGLVSVPASWIGGIATHYVLTGRNPAGNCSYPDPPKDNLFVALSPSEYNGAAACGGYLFVTAAHNTWVRVEVIDQCPECATGHIDMSERAFERLAPLPAGLINVRYKYLVNPVLPGPLWFEVNHGSSQYWLALIVGNTGNPLKSVQVRTGTSGSWQSMSHANWNAWIAQSGAGPGPFSVRLTDIQGHVVTVTGVKLNPSVVQTTKTFMYTH